MNNSNAIHGSLFVTDFNFVFKLTPTTCVMVRCSPPVLLFTDSPLNTEQKQRLVVSESE